MAGDRIEVGALLRQTWVVASAAPVAALGYVAAITALRAYSELALSASPGASFVIGIVDFVAGFILFVAMLRAFGLRGDGEGGGFGVYFVVSLLGGLGTLLGFLLLIVPGVILMVRWTPGFAVGLSEDVGGTDALTKAWRMTEGQFWPIFACLLVGIVPMAVFGVALGGGTALLGLSDYETPATVVESVVVNAAISAYSAYSTALSIAAYWMLRDEQPGLSEVFA